MVPHTNDQADVGGIRSHRWDGRQEESVWALPMLGPVSASMSESGHGLGLHPGAGRRTNPAGVWQTCWSHPLNHGARERHIWQEGVPDVPVWRKLKRNPRGHAGVRLLGGRLADW
jgi:hypothetical protein